MYTVFLSSCFIAIVFSLSDHQLCEDSGCLSNLPSFPQSLEQSRYLLITWGMAKLFRLHKKRGEPGAGKLVQTKFYPRWDYWQFGVLFSVPGVTEDRHQVSPECPRSVPGGNSEKLPVRVFSQCQAKRLGQFSELQWGNQEEGACNWIFRIHSKASWPLGLFEPSKIESHLLLKTRNYFVFIVYKILITNTSGNKKKYYQLWQALEIYNLVTS